MSYTATQNKHLATVQPTRRNINNGGGKIKIADNTAQYTTFYLQVIKQFILTKIVVAPPGTLLRAPMVLPQSL